ncbi:MAG TPA: ABC transporter permease subunit [Candidatus Limnocylindrales bacterium]
MTETALPLSTGGALSARPLRRGRGLLNWLGVAPFLLFAVAFLIIPTVYLVVGSFQDAAGALTIKNYGDLLTPTNLRTYGNSIEISAVTAIAGAILGFLLAYAVIAGGLPRFLRSALMTFSGVASNFAGVPLALAFTFTLGRVGLLTLFVRNVVGVDLYNDHGFSLFSKLGLEIVYLYFQFPLMVLIIAPAIDGLKRDWREASENMGASTFQYWRYVALPILMPSLLGSTILLFANAFGAQATAYQLTGGSIDIATIAISRQIRGDVLFNEGLGYALAMGMVVIMAVSIGLYSILQRRSERWLK